MERYRIGEDLHVLWAVHEKNGEAYPLEDKDVHLYMVNGRGRTEVEIDVQGNVVHWEYLGVDQRCLGDHTLTLEVFSNSRRVMRRDVCPFTLVPKSCMEKSNEKADALAEGNTLTLTTALDVYRIQPVIPTVGENDNWYVDGLDTGFPSRGVGAFEYAQEHGYEGTRDDYYASAVDFPAFEESARELILEATRVLTEFEAALVPTTDKDVEEVWNNIINS